MIYKDYMKAKLSYRLHIFWCVVLKMYILENMCVFFCFPLSCTQYTSGGKR